MPVFSVKDIGRCFSRSCSGLMARQLFVRDNAQMDAMDLKTLAQFCLLGDPSVHPVAEQSATSIPGGVTKADMDRYFRAERRQKMKSGWQIPCGEQIYCFQTSSIGQIVPRDKSHIGRHRQKCRAQRGSTVYGL